MRLLTFDELCKTKGHPYCRDHTRRLVKAGLFPKPIEIGTRRIAGVEEEVDAHYEALVAKRNAALEPNPNNRKEKPPRGRRGGRARQ
jgi:prophage regulatory protein